MIRYALAALAAVFIVLAIATPAEARRHPGSGGAPTGCFGPFCDVFQVPQWKTGVKTRVRAHHGRLETGATLRKQGPDARRYVPTPGKRTSGHPTASGLVAPLAAKVAEIRSDCGSRLVSGVRHTRIAGSWRMSLHASGRAADLAGNPACIYRHLKGWTARGGGYSVDYGAVRHVHVSLGGHEAGITFRHGGHRRAPSALAFSGFGGIWLHSPR